MTTEDNKTNTKTDLTESKPVPGEPLPVPPLAVSLRDLEQEYRRRRLKADRQQD